MSDRVGSATCCYNGGEANYKQCQGDAYSNSESLVAQEKSKMVWILISKYIFILIQSNLANIGASQMEEDYKLVSNEGLFQEYLEMSE